MAGAYSERRTYNNWVPPMDLNLASTVLASKEQKYNANLAKIDAVIETYAKVDLLRTSDKKLLYDNINNVIANFQGTSKLAMTNPDTMRQIEQSFTTSLTPYITEQMVNTAKYKKFQTDLATIKEKKPENYNDVNANFALKNAGFSEYMTGKTDKLGNLEYTPYTNVTKDLQPRLDTFAKEYGYENYTELRKASEDGTLYQEVRGKKLTKETLKSFLESTISSDPVLMKQLEIDAWGQFGGLSDTDFEKFYKTESQRQANNFGSAISVLEERMKTLDKESNEFKMADAQLSLMKNRKTEYENIASSPEKLNRDKVGFSIYSGNLINGLANTYSYDRQESVKFGNPYLEVARDMLNIQKTQQDMVFAQNKESRDQKIHDLKISGQLDSNGNLISTNSTGYATSSILADDQSEQGINTYSKATTDYDESYEKVRASMVASDVNFKNKTIAQQNAVISSMIDSDAGSKASVDASGTISTYSQDVKNALAEAKTAKNFITSYSKDLEVDYKDDARTMYEAVLSRGNATLNVDNIKGMPDFKKAIKSGVNFDDLSQVQKDAITYEYIRGAQSASGITKTPTERQRLDVVEKSYRKSLQKAGQTKYLTELDKSYSGRGVTSESIDPLSAGIGQAYNWVMGVGAEAVEDIYVGMLDTFSSREATDRQVIANRQKTNQYFNQLDEITRRSNQWRNEVITTDENIGAWSRGDVNVQGMNMTDFFSSRSRDRDTRYGQKDNEYSRNARTVQKVNFISEDKSNLPYINDLRAVVESQTGNKISKGSTYGYSYNPTTNMYEIDVQLQEKVKKAGKETFTDNYFNETVTVKPENMPERLRQRISPTTVNYAQSYYNPNKQTEKVNFRLPTTSDNKDVMISNILAKGNNSLEMKSALENIIKTPTERLSAIRPLIKNETQRTQLNNLYNTVFEVRFLGSVEEGYIPEVVGKNNGAEVYTEKFSRIQPTAIETPQSLLISTAHYTNLAFEDQESEIINNGNK